jgi:hypothetical protein
MKSSKIFSLFLPALLIVMMPAYSARGGNDESRCENKEKQQMQDSTITVINNKLSYYMAEAGKNNDAIKSLERELEQRRVLAERLNGAVLASREILNCITADTSSVSIPGTSAGINLKGKK